MTANPVTLVCKSQSAVSYIFPPSAFGMVVYRGWLSMTAPIRKEIDVLFGLQLRKERSCMPGNHEFTTPCYIGQRRLCASHRRLEGSRARVWRGHDRGLNLTRTVTCMPMKLSLP